MKQAFCDLISISPFSQSKYIQEPKKPRENDDEYEKRTWRYRMHTTDDGFVYIPPNMISNTIRASAKYLSIKIKGKGNQTYTKNFDAGIQCIEPIILSDQAAEVKGEWLFVPSDGKVGGSKRVMRCFPYIPSWSGTAEVYIIDDIITEDVFRKVLAVAGSLIGFGRFRPINRGYYGRFKIASIEWIEDIDLEELDV